MERAAAAEPAEILLIESDTHAARAVATALCQRRTGTSVNSVRDGVQALAFLRREGAYRLAPRPDLILLDCNAPRLAPAEFVEQLKSAPDLRNIPVLVLTDNADPGGAAKAAAIGSNGVIGKPLDAEKFAAAIGALAADSDGADDAGLLGARAPTPQSLSHLAHQLRTYLNPIIAFSEMMTLEIRGPLANEYREYARGIHLSALALSDVFYELVRRANAESAADLRPRKR